MVCCYKPLFSPVATTDEEKDLEIQSRIRSLNWVTASHLDCPFKETAGPVKELIYTSINHILELDGSKVPEDKLASVVRCSKTIFSLLQAGEAANVGSADDFLPALIYILLKANPPRLISNINFVTRFANESRLRSGEEGYYFTNLCCALSFIENLGAASLNLPQHEFDSYVAGQSIPPGSWEASLLLCEGVQGVGQSIRTLKELNSRSDKVMQECERLEKEMEEFGEFVSSEVAKVIASTPYSIRGPRKPVTLDSLSPGAEESLLPPPLLPLSTPASDTEATSKPGEEIDEDETDASINNNTKDENEADQTLEADKDIPVDPVPPAAPNPSVSSYIGFSAQSSTIPSISCNTADSDCLFPPPGRFSEN